MEFSELHVQLKADDVVIKILRILHQKIKKKG